MVTNLESLLNVIASKCPESKELAEYVATSQQSLQLMTDWLSSIKADWKLDQYGLKVNGTSYESTLDGFLQCILYNSLWMQVKNGTIKEPRELYQTMLTGEYKKAKIESIPCPLCGCMTMVARDLWLYTSNSCETCGWGTVD